ncbi:MAG TPA: iron-containing alcohol dehydrogenase, partial [Longimicrobiales bacterium]|nr:iron-containing alcohol dehydrogenase [Longimicrobiales bacterium]
ALLVRGASDRADRAASLLGEAGLEVSETRVTGEPTTGGIESAVAHARAAGCDVVVAFGGGSVIDAAKAIAALLTNPGDLRDYLEVVGAAQPLRSRAAPVIAIPTTAGTGAEVTRNSVLLAEAERVKVSLRSPLMLPAVAIVDPELTYDLPPALTASTGLDALTQCLEPFVTPAANPLTDGFAREGLRRAGRSLRTAVEDGSDIVARRDMALASLCGGLALANARLGAVHGLASPIGGAYPVPHGVVCALLLAPVTAANVRALREHSPESTALARYREAAAIVTGEPDADEDRLVAWLASLAEDFGLPKLSAYGIDDSALPDIVGKARRASSMKGNPVELSEAELTEVLKAAM